jgi:hypothetical protein
LPCKFSPLKRSIEFSNFATQNENSQRALGALRSYCPSPKRSQIYFVNF